MAMVGLYYAGTKLTHGNAAVGSFSYKYDLDPNNRSDFRHYISPLTLAITTNYSFLLIAAYHKAGNLFTASPTRPLHEKIMTLIMPLKLNSLSDFRHFGFYPGTEAEGLPVARYILNLYQLARFYQAGSCFCVG